MKAQVILTQFMLDHLNDLEFQIAHMLHDFIMDSKLI